jgi:hypothetical protein
MRQILTPWRWVIVFLSLIMISLAGCNFPQRGARPAPVTTDAMVTPEGNVPTTAYPTLKAIRTDNSPDASLTPVTLSRQTPPAPPGGAASSSSCDQAGAGNPIDLSIPDDSQLLPGQVFTKVWRLQNVGSCTWTKEYSVALFSGESMGAQPSVSLSGDVPPGQSVEISVDMIAPQTPGKHQGNWKLRNSSHEWFGIGPDGSAPFWVRVLVVKLSSTTSEPVPTTLENIP